MIFLRDQPLWRRLAVRLFGVHWKVPGRHVVTFSRQDYELL